MYLTMGSKVMICITRERSLISTRSEGFLVGLDASLARMFKVLVSDLDVYIPPANGATLSPKGLYMAT